MALAPGQEHVLDVDLIYAPDVDYRELVSNATFTIREGGKIVGYGRVLHGIDRGAT